MAGRKFPLNRWQHPGWRRGAHSPQAFREPYGQNTVATDEFFGPPTAPLPDLLIMGSGTESINISSYFNAGATFSCTGLPTGVTLSSAGLLEVASTAVLGIYGLAVTAVTAAGTQTAGIKLILGHPKRLGSTLTALWDPSDISTLFQNSGGTTPVTAAGQTVAYIADGSGNGNHAVNTLGGGIYRTEDENSWIELATATSRFDIPLNLIRNTTAYSIVSAFNNTVSGTNCNLIRISTTADGTIWLQHRVDTGAVDFRARRTHGNALVEQILLSALVLDRDHVFSHRMNHNTAIYTGRHSGLTKYDGTFLATGTTTDLDAFSADILRTFDGNFYGMCFCKGTALTDTQIRALEYWYSVKAGVMV